MIRLIDAPPEGVVLICPPFNQNQSSSTPPRHPRSDRHYRLAWREQGRQCSLYLGVSQKVVEKIRQLLDSLQRPLRQHRPLRQIVRASLAGWRAVKAQWNKELRRFGLYLKGSEIRGWCTRANPLIIARLVRHRLHQELDLCAPFSLLTPDS